MASETYDLFFLDDMETLLADATTILKEAKQQQCWDRAISFLFRTFHSLKGAAPMAGMPELESFLHRLEDLLALIQNGQLVMDAKWSNFLLTTIDVMQAEVEAAKHGKSLAPFTKMHKELIKKLPIALCDPRDESPKALSASPTRILSNGSGQKVAANRLVILYFILAEDAEMPKAAALVLERQYQEVGQVKSMVVAYDGDQPVIVGIVETALTRNELNEIATAAEVAKIYIQPFRESCYPPMQPVTESKGL